MDEGATARSPRQWSAAERNDLILWALVGFVPGALFEFVVDPHGGGATTWTFSRELPVRGVSALCLVLATFLVARRRQRSVGDYGIPLSEAFGWRFWLGAIIGFAMLSLLLLILHETGHFDIDSVALTGDAVLFSAIAWGGVFLCVAIAEELAFRGYILYVAAQRIGFWRAALAFSLGFAVSHLPNKGETALGILHTFLTAILFCFALRRTGNLWFPIGYHAAWDWAESFFYGTPDSGLLAVGHYLNTSVHGADWLSGGSAGPEGSVFSIAVLIFAALLIHVMFPTARYPVGITPAPLPS